VTLQHEVLMLIDELVRGSGMGLLLISHDLSVMARHVQRVMVMYGGTVVEAGPPRRCSSSAPIPTRAASTRRGRAWCDARHAAAHHPRPRARAGRSGRGCAFAALRSRHRRLPARRRGGRGGREPRGALHPHRGGPAMNRHAEEFARRRAAMVREQIEARGVHDARVLQAMRELPRERFVRPGWEPRPTTTTRCPSPPARPSRSPTSSPS
jgi:ABC-type glutathione transport system ATPase component